METNKKQKFSTETRIAYLYNAPVIIITLIFVLIPVIGTLFNSFFREVTFLPYKFIGIGNYTRIFSDMHFGQSVQFTILFLIVSVSLELLLGMIFALILNEVFAGRNLLNAVILIPWAIPVAISGRLWQLIYNYEFGILNYIFLHLHFVNAPVNWLGTPLYAFISIVVSDVWKTTPFISLILLTGLASITPELYKQSMIDGANIFQRFFYITLPLLRPVIIIAVLFRTIDAIRIFDLVYILTGGGPGGSTSSISLYAFKAYISGDFGYGSAISIVISFIALALAILYLKFGKYSEDFR